MAKIGVFWIYQSIVFGKSVNLEDGIEGVPGILDSPDNHADVWESERPWMKASRSLEFLEYQDVPRGRVLSSKGKPIVYLDRVLKGDANKRLISEFFEFESKSASWHSDVHYTTTSSDLNRLFVEE